MSPLLIECVEKVLDVPTPSEIEFPSLVDREPVSSARKVDLNPEDVGEKSHDRSRLSLAPNRNMSKYSSG